MRPLFFLTLAVTACCPAEVHTMTLREAVDLALRQNSDIVMSRLEEQKSGLQVRVARDPFMPKVIVGSGIAYSSGFPMNIEGSGPSIFQAQAVGTVFSKAKSYGIAQAREDARGAQLETASKREEIAMRTANLFLDAERTARSVEIARKQVESLERVAAEIAVQVEEGRALALESRRAALNLALARQRVQMLDGDRTFAENSLALVLGMQPTDRIVAADENRPTPDLPPDEEIAVDGALRTNRELRRLESSLASKTLEAKANRAERYPTVDLVAQYALFAKFNNYENYFNTFQRHNGQLGVSLRVPLYASHAATAQAAQADVDVTRLRLDIQNRRSQISLNTRKSFHEVQRAETAAEVAKLDLDLAREQISVVLAKFEEGRATLRQAEEARFMENEKWLAWLDSRYGLERARYALLKESGDLVTQLR